MPPVRSSRFATQVRACSHSECRLLLRHNARYFERDFIRPSMVLAVSSVPQARGNACAADAEQPRSLPGVSACS